MLQFDQNLAPGSIVFEVDGQVKLTHRLEDRATTDSMILPTGAHTVTVKLLDPKGGIRDTATRPVSADPGLVRTLKIQLSRFRRNLEIEATVRPEAKPAEAQTAPKPAGGTKP